MTIYARISYLTMQYLYISSVNGFFTSSLIQPYYCHLFLWCMGQLFSLQKTSYRSVCATLLHLLSASFLFSKPCVCRIVSLVTFTVKLVGVCVFAMVLSQASGYSLSLKQRAPHANKKIAQTTASVPSRSLIVRATATAQHWTYSPDICNHQEYLTSCCVNVLWLRILGGSCSWLDEQMHHKY